MQIKAQLIMRKLNPLYTQLRAYSSRTPINITINVVIKLLRLEYALNINGVLLLINTNEEFEVLMKCY